VPSVVRIIIILSVVEEMRGVNGGKNRKEYFTTEGTEITEKIHYQQGKIKNPKSSKGKMISEFL